MSTNSTPTSDAPESPPKRGWFWRIFWAFFLLIVIVAGAVAYVLWVQRYALMEDWVKNRLEQEGFTAELSIRQVTKTQADIRSITLSAEGQKFLTANRVRVDYAWRDALEGRILKLEIEKPELMLELDASGRPTSSWFPGQDDVDKNRRPFAFPPQGVLLREAVLNIQTPFGQVKADGDAEIDSLDQFTSQLNVEANALRYGDLAAAVSGPVSLDWRDQVLNFDADLDVPRWTYKDFSGAYLDFTGAGTAQLLDQALFMDGEFGAEFVSLDVGQVRTDETKLTYAGQIKVPRQSGTVAELNGEWSGLAQGVTPTEPKRRQEVTRALTLNETLSNSPVTSHFAEDIFEILDGVLTQGDLSGGGRIEKTPGRTDVYLTDVLTWSGPKGQLKFETKEGQPFYAFGRNEKELVLKTQATLDARYDVTFDEVVIVMSSHTGRDLQGVKNFDARVRSHDAWRALTPDRLPARLAPFSVKVDYDQTVPRRMSVWGAVDYDGDIPGGYATGLRTEGRLDISAGQTLQVKFVPRRGQSIVMDRFDTVTDWYAEAVKFDLADDRPFFTRRPDQTAVLETAVKNITMGLSRTDQTQSMALNIASADVSADISDREQSWFVNGGPTVMTSDNMPSPGTRMTTETFDLEAVLRPDAPVMFNLVSPKADVDTELVQARGLSVTASGTPDRVLVEYENARVKFLAATELPVMPLTGNVIYQSQVWEGEAVTFLPRAQSTPIDVSYKFDGGIGTADVNIVDLPFTPSGLQPQSLISALRGKIADVDGLASAQIKLRFGVGEPMTSSGRAQLHDMSLGTLPGPMAGVNADMGFSSFFPLKSDGPQSLTMERFDPGFPLGQGEVQFQLIPDGVDIISARWPLGDGAIFLEPSEWRYLSPENRMTLRVENVSLGEFLKDVSGENLKATGSVNGTLPIVISGVNVNVVGGRLAVEDGGVIQYKSPQTDAAAAQNRQAALAFDSLKNFQYDELELLMDGPLDGEIQLRMKFQGSNPDVLYGTPFLFNVTLSGELLNIVRSFRVGPEILNQIKTDMTNMGEELTP